MRVEIEKTGDGRVALFVTERRRVAVFDDAELARQVADMLDPTPLREPEPAPEAEAAAPPAFAPPASAAPAPWHGVIPEDHAERAAAHVAGGADDQARLAEALEEAKLGAAPMALAEKYAVPVKVLGARLGAWKRHHATAAELAEFERGRDAAQLAKMDASG